ncbi:MAG: TonB family protein [Pseudomonadota bacterium]
MERREVIIPFMASGLFHLIALAFMLYTPALAPRRSSPPPAIHVRMVALPVASVKAELPAASRKSAQARVSPRRAAPKAPPPDAVSLSTAKRQSAPEPAAIEKTSLKRKTFQSAKVMDQAIDRLEKDVEENRPDQIDAAIERLQEQVKDQPAPEPDSQDAVSQLKVDGAVREQDARALELIDIYRVEIAFIIQKNWAFSDSLAGGANDLVTEIAFDVMPDGTVSDIWFDKRSGNGYLDESARRAIIKSVPLPPHPNGVIRPAVTVGLRFTPQGIR